MITQRRCPGWVVFATRNNKVLTQMFVSLARSFYMAFRALHRGHISKIETEHGFVELASGWFYFSGVQAVTKVCCRSLDQQSFVQWSAAGHHARQQGGLEALSAHHLPPNRDHNSQTGH